MPLPKYAPAPRVYLPIWSRLVALRRHYVFVFAEEALSALAESRYVAPIRGRHPRMLETCVRERNAAGAAFAALAEDRDDLDSGVVALFAALTVAFMVVWPFSSHQLPSLITTVVVILAATLLLMVLMGTLLARRRTGSTWLAFGAALLVTLSLCLWGYGGFDVWGWVLGGAFGLTVFVVAWLVRDDDYTRTVANARNCSGGAATVCAVFAPHIAALHLVGPGYPFVVVAAAWLTALAPFAFLVYLAFALQSLLPKPMTLRVWYSFWTVMLIFTVAVSQAPAPPGPDWLRIGVHSGLIGYVASICAVLLVAIADGLVQLLSLRQARTAPPHETITVLLLFAVFDAEFGDLWRRVQPPRALSQRDLRKWLRHRLSSGTPPRRRHGRGVAWTAIDEQALERIPWRLDSVIWLLRVSVAPSLTVITPATNMAVHHELNRIQAALVRLQRAVLLREGTPEDVVRTLCTDLEAALTRQWAGFVRDDDGQTTVAQVKTIGRILARVLVAVTPLGIAIAVQLTLPGLGSLVQGSLYTFAISWLTASVLRIIDPKVDDTAALADKLGSVIRPRS